MERPRPNYNLIQCVFSNFVFACSHAPIQETYTAKQMEQALSGSTF